MSNTITFRVDGTPKAQPRVKAYTRGRHAAVYTPDSANGWKELVGNTARQHLPATPLLGPIKLIVEFYFERPKSHYGTGKNADKLKASAPDYHIVKPDCDNLVKAIKDVLSDVELWGDDKQVFQEVVLKWYCGSRRVRCGGKPGVYVQIEEVKS